MLIISVLGKGVFYVLFLDSVLRIMVLTVEGSVPSWVLNTIEKSTLKGICYQKKKKKRVYPFGKMSAKPVSAWILVLYIDIFIVWIDILNNYQQIPGTEHCVKELSVMGLWGWEGDHTSDFLLMLTWQMQSEFTSKSHFYIIYICSMTLLSCFTEPFDCYGLAEK